MDTACLIPCIITTNSGCKMRADMTPAQLAGYAPDHEIVFAYHDLGDAGEIVCEDVPMYAIVDAAQEA